jgi:hypothetical protein
MFLFHNPHVQNETRRIITFFNLINKSTTKKSVVLLSKIGHTVAQLVETLQVEGKSEVRGFDSR